MKQIQNEITVPFITDEQIENSANEFRRENSSNTIPVDIEKIIDVNLGIDIIPVLEMEIRANTNALITSNWEAIYVDKHLFEDERRRARLNFSLAHEIGHFILHRSTYNELKVDSVEAFYDFMQNISTKNYGYLETQANKFASYVLIPRDTLQLYLEEELQRVSDDVRRINKKSLKGYIAIPLAKKFCVSEQAMEIALSDVPFFSSV